MLTFLCFLTAGKVGHCVGGAPPRPQPAPETMGAIFSQAQECMHSSCLFFNPALRENVLTVSLYLISSSSEWATKEVV